MYREYRIGHRRLKIFLGDITDLPVDAIVNSENSDLIMDRPDGPSVSAAIRRRAGDGFAESVAAQGPVEIGRAVITPSRGALRCKHVIHAAVVRRLSPTEHLTEPAALRKAVRSSLELASALGLKSLAFPAFGVRAAQVPKELSSDLMIEEVTRFLQGHSSLDEVIFALLDPESFLVFFERAILRYAEYSAPIELSVQSHPSGYEIKLNEGGPVAARELVPASGAPLTEIASRFRALQSAAQRRLLDAPQLLRSLGGFLWNFLLPPQIRERLEASRAANLTLELGEGLLAVPLELAWNGRSFLTERFRIGRQLALSATTPKAASHNATEALLICDSRADLPAAHSEGLELFELFAHRNWNTQLRSASRAHRSELLSLLPRARLLHFSGHGALDEKGRCGWLLHDTLVLPEDWKHAGCKPDLVFSNACGHASDGLLGEARLQLGQAILAMGARHFIGSLWELEDRLARDFAIALYSGLLDGRDLGDAIRAARAAIKERSGAQSLDWAAYIHYGDPRENPLAERRSIERQ